MAGDWLKIECSLSEKPETLAITVAMGWDDPDLTVGKLIRVFRWFDQHTVDGNARSVTPALLDRLIGVSGFVQAMHDAGWIVVSDAGIALQNFDKHNGATAKSRAQTAKRVANHRASASETEGCDSGNGASVTEALAREEKRREEEKNSPSLRSGERRVAPRPSDEVPPSVLIEAGFDEKAASDFIAHKRKHKAPLTSRAWIDHQRESQKAGWSVQQAAEKVMAKSWRGFEAKYVADERPPQRAAPQAESFRERDLRLASERVAAFTGRRPADIREVIEGEVTDVTPRALGR